MLILAVDASTDRLSIAAGQTGGRMAVRAAEGARRHAGLLVPLALEALGELGADLNDIEALAVADGPGSFTGLRVAAAWAKAIARVRGVPLWTASTLLVRATVAEAPGALVLGVHSALRGEWYVGGYRFGSVGQIVTELAPIVMAPGSPALIQLEPAAVVGDGAAAAVAAALGRSGRVVGPPNGLPEAARLIGLIGRSGGATRIADPATWEPIYGRPAEAQAKWEREHGRALPDPAGAPG